jgi:micrococcal nuclease
LALLLNRLFYSPAPILDFTELAKTYGNGIEAKEAGEKVGKRVTVFARVYGVNSTSTITRLSLGGSYPNSPLTVVIFAKNYDKFDVPFEDLFKGQNIRVKGTIELYKDKPQLIIENPGDIVVL